MNPWIILNIVAGIIVAMVLSYKLILHSHRFTLIERFGMAMIGAAMILNVGPLAATTAFHCRQPTPFDDWGGALLRVGCAIYFIGRMLDVRARRRV